MDSCSCMFGLDVWRYQNLFGVLKELDVDILVGISFINLHVRCIFSSLRNITLRKSRSAHISTLGYKNEKSINPIVTNDVCAVTENTNKGELCVAWQLVIKQRSKSSVLIVFTMAVLQLMQAKSKTPERKQIIVSGDVANLFPLVPLNVFVTSFSKKTGSSTRKDSSRTFGGTPNDLAEAMRTIRANNRRR